MLCSRTGGYKEITELYVGEQLRRCVGNEYNVRRSDYGATIVNMIWRV